MDEVKDTRNKIDQTIEIIDQLANAIVCHLSPMEMGRLLHPDAEPIKLKSVPTDVIADHLTRYSKSELQQGQFFKIRNKYTFIMGQAAYDKRRR